ncbi:MAG: hypothetical protein Q4G27_07350 [Flavobacteriaceae bacterium]|nr:hypothetical protein [Flavobacteriaceae bacterium]
MVQFSAAQNCSLYQFNAFNKSYDSIYYGENYKQILDSITASGYYTLKIQNKIENPCQYFFDKGNQFKKIYLNNVSLKNRFIQFDETHQLFYTLHLDDYIQTIKDSLENSGKPFAGIRILPNAYIDHYAIASIDLESEKERYIDDIKIIGYEQVPKFLKREALRRNKLFTPQAISHLEKQINEYHFINQYEVPRVSFTKDSTIIYLYLKKRKQSYFDGLAGFETDSEGKFSIQGNIHIQLLNAFNGFEQIKLQWESGLNKSQNLNFMTHIPYIFNSRFGVGSQLNIHKQDSSYVRLEFRNQLVYQLSPFHYFGGNFNLAHSNYIRSTQSNQSDFSKIGFGVSYFFQDNRIFEFQENKSLIDFKSSLWKLKQKESDSAPSRQTEINYLVSRQQRITKNHYTYLSVQGKSLIQDTEYLLNDMFMTGGFHNLRGYNQNSIITPSFHVFSLAYRYIPASQILFEAFADAAIVRNSTHNQNETLIAYGIGTQFYAGFGIFQINFAIPHIENQGFNISSGKIHLGIKTYF